jgi:hypothetical protein
MCSIREPTGNSPPKLFAGDHAEGCDDGNYRAVGARGVEAALDSIHHSASGKRFPLFLKTGNFPICFGDRGFYLGRNSQFP